MSQHQFLMNPAKWLGEGKISLSLSDETLDFYTRWHLMSKDLDGNISGYQEVQIKGLSDIVNNQFIISDITRERFAIELENVSLGNVIGKGVITDQLIAWEFRSPELGFEGFEFYEKQDDNTYLFQAEYTTPDMLRTEITGKIWQKE